MFESFFHLHGSPFPATPIVANYFPCQAIESARQSLIRVIDRAEGPGLIVGPAGVGKSLLLQVLADHFSQHFRVILLSEARVFTRKSLLQCILYELGLAYRGLDEGELRLTLIDALRPSEICPNGILLLIDEAHSLPVRLLDEVRMITNVVRDGLPRVRLVMAGGPRLEERFANPRVESLNQRIAARCYLQSLTRDETFEYVRAQLSWVGGDPDAIFGDDAIRAVFNASDGIPRLVNQICDHAMLLAESHGIQRLDAALIQEAWSDLQQLPPPWQNQGTDPNASKSTVIEFGELDDGDVSSALEIDYRDQDLAMQPDDLRSYAYGDTSHPEELPGPVLKTSLESAVPLLVGLPLANSEIEWFDGSYPLAAPVDSVPSALDPFDAEFDEEVVVIDRHVASEIEAFRGRRRVSCAESEQLIADLAAAMAGSGNQVAAAKRETSSAPSVDAAAFAFTTLECTSNATLDIPALSAAEGLVHDALGGSDLDFDEILESVPLPWTRGTLGDDRDVIIIEEEEPAMNVFAEKEESERPRRMEYRELFAQLRRASS